MISFKISSRSMVVWLVFFDYTHLYFVFFLVFVSVAENKGLLDYAIKCRSSPINSDAGGKCGSENGDENW